MLFAFRSTIDPYEELRLYFLPYAELWMAVQEFLQKKKEWAGSVLHQIQPEEVDALIKSSIRVIGKLGKVFRKDVGAFRVLQQFKAEITEQNKLLPKIEILCNDNLRERHWKKVLELLGAKFNWKNITLNEITFLNFENKLEHLADISDEANKELALESILEKMKSEWQSLHFRLTTFRDTGIPILQGSAIEDIQVLLDDHLLKAQNMRGSLYIRPFQERVLQWEQTLLTINHMIEEWVAVQTAYLYLEPVFNSQDMKRQMPGEATEFQRIDEMWRDMMSAMAMDTLVLHVDRIPHALTRLKRANKSLQRIQRCLHDYLDSKRAIFSRFYFLSNEELLEILGERRKPVKLQTHLKKCFEGVAALRFTENAVTSLISPEGEQLTLLVPVYPEKYEGNVEHWLAELELQMKSRVKQLFHQVLADNPAQHSLNRIQWLSRWPAQIILAISQISRTVEVEEALNSYYTPSQNIQAEEEALSRGRRALQDCLDSIQGSLAGVVSMVRSGKLTQRLQILLGALIVQEVHARDVCELLINEHVSRVDAFEWQAQLRVYYDRNFDKVHVRMVNTSLLYGYEYLGNTSRLVITPLTDRCYRTLMGAIALNLGGAPQGPAGTGKTESTKDLAKAVGVQCVIFNCSEGLNAQLMGQMFRGLASSGAWSCFDEFNRIELEVLSVIAQQILELQNAKSRRVSRFLFEDKELDLNPSCNIFITMNPGYAGRSNLPDNLKALFRPVAMMVPDYALIAQISLYSFGFQKARELAHKVVVTFHLSEEQLSSQDHYDYGMRSVKAVLNTAAQLKLTSPKVEEDALILEALRDSNLPKFLKQDAILFEGILSDLFPDTMDTPPPDQQLQAALIRACETHSVQAVSAFVNKCVQLNETIKYRHGVMVVGAACGGKSTALSVLSKAQQILKNPVRRYTMNPKAVTLSELYGSYDAISHDWADGILVHIFRRAAYKDQGARWLIFDGPVDTEWVENMNTVLDDTKKLCLSNGETILMPSKMRLLFEVDNLSQASPATISRCGMVAMHPDFIGWEAIFLSWLGTLTCELEMLESRIQTQLTVFLTPLFSAVKQQLSSVSLLPLLTALLRLYGGLLRSPHFLQLFKQARVRQDEVNMHLDMFFLYSALWSFGTAPLTRESQQNVVTVLRRLSTETHQISQSAGGRPFKIERTSLFPDSQRFSAFDYYIDGLRWRPWTQILDKLDYEDREHIAERSQAPHEIIVPTVESLKYTYNINVLLQLGHAPMLVGGTGTGKTATLQRFLSHLEEQRYVRAILSFSSATKSRTAQSMLEAKLERRSRKQYGPPVGKKLIVVIDDLNLPNHDAYGSQPPVELLRQVLDHGGWYSQEDSSKQFKEIVDVQLIGSMGTGGVSSVTPRFLRHFNLISIPDFTVTTLTRIFSKQMESYLVNSDLTPDIRKLYQQAVLASVTLYSQIVQGLRPTPKTLLYMFNLRDLVRLMQGLQLYHHQSGTIRNTLESQRKIIRLWVHECIRVFGDRVVEIKDYNWLQKTLFDACRDKIRDDLNVVLRRGGAQHPLEMLEQLKWCDLFEVARYGRAYQEVDITPKELQDRLATYLEEFNSVSKSPMDLVLFEFAVSHLLRIARVLRLSNGHAMLVGIDGTGRRCLTRLSAYIQDTEMYEIEVSVPQDWQEGLVGILRESAVNGKRSVLYLTQQQVQGRVANDINSLLNIGEVPGLLSSEDLYSFGEKLRLVAKKEGRAELSGNEAVNAYFKKRVRERLHVILGFSPLGSQLRNTIRAFPSLIHCCTVNFMEGWPDEALQAVADHFIQKQEQRQVGQVAKVMHRSAVALAELYQKEEKRHNYVTPATFLELLLTFKQLMERRKEELENQKLGYEKGVEKLQFTANEVTKMQEDLSDKEPKLHQMAQETEELMERVRYEAEEVVEPQQRIIQREEALTNEAFMAAEAMKNECKADLAVAKPMVDAAIAALNTIKPQDIIELKNLLKPPMVIRKVLHAVCVMCQVEPIKTPKPDHPKEFEVNWWETSRRFMGHKDFLAQIINFDKDHIPEHVMGHIRTHFLPDPEFKPSRAKQASLAAKGLCQWVRALDKYDIVAKEVAPKRAKAKESERAAKEAKRNLKQKQEELRQVQEHLERLKGDLDFSARKKRKLELDIAECKLKIARATQLLDSLGGEQQRWTQISRELEHALDSLLGDVLLSSGMIVYLGVYPSQYREKALSEWGSLVREAGIPGSRSFEFSEVLGTAVKKRQWQMNGLPSDLASYESALIMQNSRKWALFIDPQSQGNRWLKREHAHSTHFHVARLSDLDLLRTFQNCLQFGLPLLLENVQESIDPRLEGVLSKQIFKQSGALSVKLGDQVIEYNKEFKLYLTTKLPNPHYLPRISTKITLINLSITESGLADQLLDLVIQRERPTLEEDRNRLIVQNYEHNRLLREAEEKILEILRTTGTNILDNEAAISVLKESQRIAKETKSKQEAAAVTESHIQEARLLYEPLARYSSILFFTVQLLSRLSPMYLFSLSWYLQLFHRSLENAPPAQEVEERVQAIQDTLVRVLYSTITRSFFQEHKLLFSFLVALKTSIHKEQIHPSLIFTFAKPWQIPEDQNVANPFTWLQDGLFRRINYLQSVGNTSALSSLIQNIAHNSPKWRSLMDRDGAALIQNFASEWPEANSYEQTPPLSLFEKLLVIKALAPDRVVQGVQIFVKESLGEFYVQPPIFELEQSYAHSAADIPLIFVLPGNDPLVPLTHLAQEKRKYDSMKKISLGQGTGPAAQKAIDEAKRMGHWVILQNCHLAPSWMPQLERIVESLETKAVAAAQESMQHSQHKRQVSADSKSGCHPSFRLWLTTYSSEHFPALVLQKGVKIVNEPPAGLKANLLGSYTGSHVINSSDKFDVHPEVMKRLIFSLCVFHALVQERRKYGPLGWNQSYNFTPSDLDISIKQLYNLLQTTLSVDTIPWNALIYLTAGCNYGGRVTDEHDRQLLACFLENFYNPDSLAEHASISNLSEFPYPEQNLTYPQTLKFLRNVIPLDQPASLFGLHSNADIVKEMNSGRTLCDSLFSLRSGFQETKGHQLVRSPYQSEDVAPRDNSQEFIDLCSNLLSRLSEPFDIEKISTDRPLSYENSMNAVLLHQIERYNGLVRVIHTSLNKLIKALLGQVLMTEELDDVKNSLIASKVPKLWLQHSYPSQKSLATYVNDLTLRLDLFGKWVQQGPPSVFWFSGFFYAQSFLTALLQSHARAHSTSIDALDFHFAYSHNEPPSSSNETMYIQMGEAEKGITRIYGLYVEGGSWNYQDSRLDEPKHRVLIERMPIISLRVMRSELIEEEPNSYSCPVYQTQARRGNKAGPRGHSSNFIRQFTLPSSLSSAHWKKRGVALICQKSE